MTFADNALGFFRTLSLSAPLPAGVGVMNPYQEPAAYALCEKFYHRFYGDEAPRTIVLGINPGRFGAGITGIPFTDPVKLQSLGITNELKKKTELSADFIYSMIDAQGGPATFYRKFYISAISPLGFVKDGKNLNYYDIRALQEAIEPFAVQCLKTQIGFGVRRDVCFCLGEGKNAAYLQRLNDEHGFFDRVVPLPHPRFIMQYRRKFIAEYVRMYRREMSQAG